MNRRLIIVAAMMTVFSFAAGAQSYDGVFKRNFWNDGKGYVGIRQDSVSVSVAEASAGYTGGNLRSSNDAANAWTASVRAGTVTHLKRFSLAGTFSFEQLWGKQMAGSMFVRPGFYPIDIYEFTPGDKSRQIYSFTGGVSVDLSDHWRAGAGMDFTSSNFSKRKDLRHTTYMLDLAVKPGIQYHNGKFAVGLNYIFSKNSENISAEQVGSATNTYEVFLNKGLYYGVRQLWTGAGVHLNESGVSGLPLTEYINGVSLQMSCGNLYAGAQWRHRSGFAGEKQKVWYRFEGNEYSFDSGYRMPAAAGTHTIRFSLSGYLQDNDETVLEQINQGGVTTTAELGANRVFTRSEFNMCLSYDFSGKGWSAGVSLPFSDREGNVSVLYPFVNWQSLQISAFELRGSRQFGRFNARLAFKFSNGCISEDSHSVTDGSGVTGKPERLESYFIKYREHMTNPKTDLSPSLRYSFLNRMYIEGAVWWQHGFRMVYLGNDRVNATVKFGYDF